MTPGSESIEVPSPGWVDDGYWFSTIADTMLILPEERAAVARHQPVGDLFTYWRGHHRPHERPAARPPQRIAADRRSFVEATAGHLPARPANPPSEPYRYVEVHPDSERTFHKRLEDRLSGRQDRPASQAEWVRVGPADEVLRLLDDRQRRAHLAEALAEDQRRTPSFGAHSRSEFIARLRPGGGLQPHHLLTVGTLLYRAWKLAMYCRVAHYLDVRYPAWRDPTRWNVQLPLGDGGRLHVVTAEPLPGPVPEEAPRLLKRLPVPALWLGLWDQWVEPFDCVFADLAPLAERGPRLRGMVPEDKGNLGVRAKLAAFVELAAADIRPPLEATPFRPVTRWTPAQRLFLSAVATMVDYAEVAAEVHAARDPQPSWTPPRQRIVPVTEVPGAAERDEAQRGRDERQIIDLQASLEHHEVDRRYGQSAADAARTYFSDPDRLHEWAVVLRRHEDRDVRLRLTRQLIVPLTARVRDLGDDDVAIADIMNTVQMLSFDISTLAPEETDRVFLPLIAALPAGVGGPFVANVLRSIAIQHSKAHRYPDAQRWMLRAQQWLRVRQVSGRSRRYDGEIQQLHEARQQVALQANGLYVRIVEWLLSHPKYATRSYGGKRAFERLREFATHALRYAGDAYGELELIQRQYTLPSTKTKARAATLAWVTNTRCMFMRALLLRAMLHLVEADSAYLTAEERPEARKSAAVLLDYVPILYRETTSSPLAAAHVNELTRIALHYGFLTGQRFLPPGNPTIVPEHLARSRPGSARDGSVGRFDLTGASNYLIRQGHDAGILASITYEPAIAVLQRHSLPTTDIPDGPHGRRDRPPSYREWLGETDLARKLARRFSPGEFLRTSGLLTPQSIPDVPF
ncbi:hypothetical protein [Micromonospora sp. NBRC 101691]|uniref:hypothetical protein n=1 Tax=Micromonospora sp. NBRC 101691 TaxID=3032198 RepID=UPI002555D993|nr:hypothetical protein [Micromonospora sp. NBRC 101691]